MIDNGQRARKHLQRTAVPLWLISVETQKVPESWIHQHRLVGIHQVKLPQLGSSAGAPDSINELIKLLVGNLSFFQTDQRVV